MEDINTVANKNYMSIAVSVQNWKFTARNNRSGVRQESGPQSANAYSFETLWATCDRSQTFDKQENKQCQR
jgi:hypothetical protein